MLQASATSTAQTDRCKVFGAAGAFGDVGELCRELRPIGDLQ